MCVNNSLVCWGIEKHGSDEQKEKFLRPLASGQIHGGFCLSEPEAGSDATSQRTTAIDMCDYYLLNGTKNHLLLNFLVSIDFLFHLYLTLFYNLQKRNSHKLVLF